MSQAQSANEVKYRMAVSFLNKLLERSLITRDEFGIAERYSAEKYRPILRSI